MRLCVSLSRGVAAPLGCGRLNWKYCHGILESWRKNGLFTMADVLEKDAPPQKPETAPEPDDPWRYIP